MIETIVSYDSCVYSLHLMFPHEPAFILSCSYYITIEIETCLMTLKANTYEWPARVLNT